MPNLHQITRFGWECAVRRRWDGFSGQRAFAALLLAGACAPAAFGNPTGPAVVSGSAAISSPAAKVLQVVNSPNTIINWQGFSIGGGETTRFVQQNAASAVLNRVTGPDASSILGTLSSNGRVFLINPHGILFGQGSVIHTAGFIASTLNMTDRDFLEGRLKFEGGGNGVLRNEGSIRVRGDILLVGPQIENAGLIRSAAGSVLLLAGQSVTVSGPDAQGIQFAIQAPADRALNLGTIEAKNAVGLFAGTLRHSGDIRIVNAGMDGAGRVILAAQQDAIVEGNATISVDNSIGKGGSIRVTGEHVGVFDSATVTARGAAGGGEILIGGDYQGRNASVRNADVTYFGENARLDASATSSGDGGKVIVWAADTTRAYGTIAARGGPQGGAGGLVETSGKRFLDVTRAADVSAPQGRGGEWLLDPEDITVSGAGNSNITSAPTFKPAAAGASSTLNIGVLQGAVNAGGTVTLDTTPSAGGAGSGNGDITFNTGASFSPGANAVLNLRAHRNITLNSGLTKSGGAGTLAVNFIPNQAGPAGGIATIFNGISSSGTLNIGGDVTLASGDFNGSTNIAAGGTLTINSGPADTRFDNSITTNIFGTLRWAGTSNLRGGFDSTINVQSGGVFDIQNNQQMLVFGGAGGALLNVLAGGTIRKSAGAGTTTLGVGQGWTVNNAGLVEVQTGTLRTGTTLGQHASTGEWRAASGATLLLDNINLNTGTTLTGTGLIKPGTGPFNIVGTVSAQNFTQATGSADIGGAGTLTVSNQFDWTGGNIFGGQIKIAPGATMNLNGSGPDLRIEGATINNFGTMNWIGTSNLRGAFDSTINVQSGGVFDIQNNQQMLVFGGAGIGLLNVNAGGVLKKSAGAGTSILSAGQGWQITNQGKIAVESGSLSIGDGAGFYAGSPHVSTGELSAAAGTTFYLTGNQTHQLGDGAKLTGAGTFDPGTGSLQVIGAAAGVSIEPGAALALNSYALAGAGKLVNKGTLDFNNSSFAGSFVNQGALNVNSGTSTFNGTSFDLNNGGTLTIAGGATLDKDTGAFNWNGGTLAGSGALAMTGGASFGLPGSGARILNGLTVSTSNLDLGGGSLTVQAGTLNAAGTTTLAAGTLLDVTGGTFNAGGGTVNVAGTLHAGGGTISASTLNVNAGGLLSGGGAITANVNNDGTLTPGNSPGTLTINGNYVQGAGGTLAIELGGTTQGVNYDLLQITGTANLNGTLGVSRVGGFTGAVGNTFDVMTYASRSGDFSAFNVPAGLTMTGTPNAAFYQLAITAVAAPLILSSGSATDGALPVFALDSANRILATLETRNPRAFFLAGDDSELKQLLAPGQMCR